MIIKDLYFHYITEHRATTGIIPRSIGEALAINLLWTLTPDVRYRVVATTEEPDAKVVFWNATEGRTRTESAGTKETVRVARAFAETAWESVPAAMVQQLIRDLTFLTEHSPTPTVTEREDHRGPWSWVHRGPRDHRGPES